MAQYLPIYFPKSSSADDQTQTLFASVNFANVIVCGILSTYAGGWLVGWLCVKEFLEFMDFFQSDDVVVCCSFHVSFLFLLFWSSKFELSLVGLGIGYFMSETWIPPLISTIQSQFSSQPCQNYCHFPFCIVETLCFLKTNVYMCSHSQQKIFWKNREFVECFLF